MIVPNADAIMQRDQAIADRQNRRQWQRERIAFERRHKAELQTYVETRLALAEDRARVELIRATQLASARAAARNAATKVASVGGGATGSAATSLAGAWFPGTRQNSASPPAASANKIADAARHIVKQIPERTRQIIDGDDELVTSNLSHGLPKGLAVFLALFMLHIPSVAIASLVTGVVLIRGHRPKAGSLFLGLAAILGVVIFSLLPW